MFPCVLLLIESCTMLCTCARVVFVFLFYLHFASSTSFSITRIGCKANGVTCAGDARSKDGSIQLNTISIPYRAGRAMYVDPVRLRDSSTENLTDFTTHFSFTINTFIATQNNYSDGFAFYISPLGYGIPPDSTGGFLGLFNYTTFNGVPQNRIVLVEFDTRPNTDLGDPPVQHVGINNNSLTPLDYTYAEENFGNHSGEIGNAWITYNGTSKNLGVSWEFKGHPRRSLSHIIDLSFMPDMVTIGFSAATGLNPESHVIHSWDFSSTLDSTPSKSKKNVLIIVATCSFILVVGVFSVSWFIIKRIRNKHDSRGTILDLDLHRITLPKRFSYQELVVATNDFAEDGKLGRGGSGQVYKGILTTSGQIVAIKRIFAQLEGSEKIFINEVNIIGCLTHRNIVRFIGWGHEKGEFFLVYEYMPKGSLDTHLFNQTTPFPWNLRYKIALQLATALHYLHEEADPCVLHRDIKPANILLDMDFNIKLGDFGVAKLVDPMFSQTTKLVGTVGYLAPEYLNEGKPTKESDIFSLGVVMLEIACGRRTHLQNGEYHVPLSSWVWQLYVEGHILDAADERLAMDFDTNEMNCLLTLGLWCTHLNPRERPTAGQVIKVLQIESSLPVLARDRPIFLDMPNFFDDSSSVGVVPKGDVKSM